MNEDEILNLYLEAIGCVKNKFKIFELIKVGKFTFVKIDSRDFLIATEVSISFDDGTFQSQLDNFIKLSLKERIDFINSIDYFNVPDVCRNVGWIQLKIRK